MSFIDLIDKARDLIGGGGIDSLSEKAGELSDIAQGDGSVLEKAQQAAEGIGEGGDLGDAADNVGNATGDLPGESER
jgi:hypothetical protein